MLYIWFNPETDLFEKGNEESFLRIKEKSELKEKFTIHYQLNPTIAKLSNSILDRINLIYRSS
jgi:hypothetical protein